MVMAFNFSNISLHGFCNSWATTTLQATTTLRATTHHRFSQWNGDVWQDGRLDGGRT